MAIPRFYIDLPAQALQGLVDFPEKVARHAGRALRLRQGDIVEVFNGHGQCAQGPIHFESDRTYATVTPLTNAERESPLALTLIQSWVSPEKLEWIVEKAVELGVHEVVMLPAQRSVTRLEGTRLEKRLAKLQEQIISACEQCGRNRLLRLRHCTTIEALQDTLTSVDARFVLTPTLPPAPQHNPLTTTPTSIAFAVGPEGGFSDQELALFAQLGWQALCLGPRVLRTETAGLVAATYFQTRWGDFAP